MKNCKPCRPKSKPRRRWSRRNMPDPILSTALTAQTNQIAEELSRMPNRLLLRCVLKKGDPKYVLLVSPEEVQFLTEKGIAEVCVLNRTHRSYVKRFFPPWKEKLNDLVQELHVSKPNLTL